jgi:hypothetical protein
MVRSTGEGQGSGSSVVFRERLASHARLPPQLRVRRSALRARQPPLSEQRSCGVGQLGCFQPTSRCTSLGDQSRGENATVPLPCTILPEVV